MNPTPDITQHPLYRPHHGDMKGWRYLEDHETIQSGDEWIGQANKKDKWETDRDIVGWIVGENNNYCVYRRRISPESKPACKQCGKALGGLADESYCKCSECISKPADQKRFVTLAVEVVSAETAPTIAKLLMGYKFEIREGNALAALDGIEDRAIEAVRQAVKGGAK